MSEVELSSVVNMILENPELVAKIKSMAEKSKNDEASSEKEEPIAQDEETSVSIAPEPIKTHRKANSTGRRGELLHALSPYISESRQKALETFMTIADILDMMREK